MSSEHWGADTEAWLYGVAAEVETYAKAETPRFGAAVVARFSVAFPRLFRAHALIHEINLLLSGDIDEATFCASFDKLLLPPEAEHFDIGTALNVDQRALAAANAIAEHYAADDACPECCEIIKKHLSEIAGDAVSEYARLSRNGGLSAVSVATGDLALHIVRQCQAQLAEQKTELDRIKQACAKSNNAICQTLAQALGGYLWLQDDPVNFPGATEADGVLVVEQTAEDLAQLAAERIRALDALDALLNQYAAACLAAGQHGGEYRIEMRQLRAKIDAVLRRKPAEGGAP